MHTTAFRWASLDCVYKVMRSTNCNDSNYIVIHQNALFNSSIKTETEFMLSLPGHPDFLVKLGQEIAWPGCPNLAKHIRISPVTLAREKENRSYLTGLFSDIYVEICVQISQWISYSREVNHYSGAIAK